MDDQGSYFKRKYAEGMQITAATATAAATTGAGISHNGHNGVPDNGAEGGFCSDVLGDSHARHDKRVRMSGETITVGIGGAEECAHLHAVPGGDYISAADDDCSHASNSIMVDSSRSSISSDGSRSNMSGEEGRAYVQPAAMTSAFALPGVDGIEGGKEAAPSHGPNVIGSSGVSHAAKGGGLFAAVMRQANQT